MDDVAKHKTAKDCWVVVGDMVTIHCAPPLTIVMLQVLDVTDFLPDHPGALHLYLISSPSTADRALEGGKKAILMFAGKDATEEFDMLHKREVIPKYAPEVCPPRGDPQPHSCGVQAHIGTLKK